MGARAAGGGCPVSLEVSRGDRCVRVVLASRAPAARAALLLLAGIWTAFAAVWVTLVVTLGGPLLLALAGLLFLPIGGLAAARVIAGAPDRWVVEVDPGRGVSVARSGPFSRRAGRPRPAFTVPLGEVREIEAADRPGPGGLPRRAIRVRTPSGERWLGEGHAREELERAAAVLQEGVRSARAPAVPGDPPRSS